MVRAMVAQSSVSKSRQGKGGSVTGALGRGVLTKTNSVIYQEEVRRASMQGRDGHKILKSSRIKRSCIYKGPGCRLEQGPIGQKRIWASK